jgi:alkanesulfonate monooxygenase SsuD/methylene tetrahydromethanopterin reductase-like flavin-dependent oxidoreductase (luciferase family)
MLGLYETFHARTRAFLESISRTLGAYFQPHFRTTASRTGRAISPQPHTPVVVPQHERRSKMVSKRGGLLVAVHGLQKGKDAFARRRVRRQRKNATRAASAHAPMLGRQCR